MAVEKRRGKGKAIAKDQGTKPLVSPKADELTDKDLKGVAGGVGVSTNIELDSFSWGASNPAIKSSKA